MDESEMRSSINNTGRHPSFGLLPVRDALALSRLLAHGIVRHAGRPDLIVGLANGALLVTTVCGCPTWCVCAGGEAATNRKC